MWLHANMSDTFEVKGILWVQLVTGILSTKKLYVSVEHN